MRKLRTSGKSQEKKDRPAFGKNLVFTEFQMHKMQSNPRLRPSLPKNKYPLRQSIDPHESKQTYCRQETPSIEQGSTNCETNNQTKSITKSITQHKYLNSVDFTPNDTVHSTLQEPPLSKNLPKFKSTVPLRRQASTLSVKDK